MMSPDEENPFAPRSAEPPPIPPRESKLTTERSNPFAETSWKEQVEPISEAMDGSTNEIQPMYRNFGMQDLSKKEMELKKREEELERKEKILQEALERAPKAPNWPRWKPILYHSIRDEIPIETQGMVRMAYVDWIITFIGYLFNWIVIFIMFVSGTDTGVADWFFATLVSALGIPLSFTLWYRGLYRAAQTRGSTLAYGKFFVHWLVHMIWTVWTLVAAPTVAEYCAGFFIMIRELDNGGAKGIAFAVMCLINIVIWMVIFFLSFYIGKQALSEFRAGGGPRNARASARATARAASIVLAENGTSR